MGKNTHVPPRPSLTFVTLILNANEKVIKHYAIGDCTHRLKHYAIGDCAHRLKRYAIGDCAHRLTTQICPPVLAVLLVIT